MALQKKIDFKLRYDNDRIMYDDAFRANFPNVQPSIVETIVIENAYIMVNVVEGDKSLLKFSVSIFNDASKNCTIGNETYDFVPDVGDAASNFIKQAYLYLKSLPKYAEAIDC